VGALTSLSVLAELRVLVLGGDTAAAAMLGDDILRVHGDLGSLRALSQLRHLDLRGTAVTGSVDLLATRCPLLGRPYLAPDGATVPGVLLLTASAVHGPVAALQALPGLGRDWANYSDCSAFASMMVAQQAPATGTASTQAIPPVACD
jgi:hypothetical protein